MQNPETGNWEIQDAYGPAPKSLFQLYEEGGYIWMSAITVCLIGILFAAWKAPRWIKEIGLLALILGVYSFLLGINDMSEILSSLEIGKEISSCLLFGGLRAALITPMYGLIVYGISLCLRIALKPRI